MRLARGRRWAARDVPSQAGRVAVVTGASGGIGLETARVLARNGATVILACRDPAKAARAASDIAAQKPGKAARAASHAEPAERGGAVRVVRLDLASLASVRAAAAEIRAVGRLDLLINNAGVMDAPQQRTEDGFELTLATNHLGHFALTGLLLDLLLTGPGSDAARVVTVSSVGHASGEMHFDDLGMDAGYRADAAYWQSKLANLLFAYELQARLAAAGAAAASLAAHPGIVRTDLWRSSSALERAVVSRALRPVFFWAVQGPARGALPVLRAATDPAARGGEYYGPAGPRGYAGHPVRVQSSERSHDRDAQLRLWEISERLTGVAYPLAPAAGLP